MNSTGGSYTFQDVDPLFGELRVDGDRIGLRCVPAIAPELLRMCVMEAVTDAEYTGIMSHVTSNHAECGESCSVGDDEMRGGALSSKTNQVGVSVYPAGPLDLNTSLRFAGRNRHGSLLRADYRTVWEELTLSEKLVMHVLLTTPHMLRCLGAAMLCLQNLLLGVQGGRPVIKTAATAPVACVHRQQRVPSRNRARKRQSRIRSVPLPLCSARSIYVCITGCCYAAIHCNPAATSKSGVRSVKRSSRPAGESLGMVSARATVCRLAQSERTTGDARTADPDQLSRGEPVSRHSSRRGLQQGGQSGLDHSS